MFRKLQFRFIATFMSAVIIVFAMIFTTVFFMNRSAYDRGVLDVLNENAQLYFNNENANKGVLVISFGYGSVGDTYLVIQGENEFTVEQIERIVSSAQKISTGSGSVDNLYYLVAVQDAETVLTAVDVSHKISDSISNFTTTSIVFIILFAVVSFFVVLSSYTILRPIKESFYKQQQFVSDASHELRTPITIISANADVLKSINNNPENDKYLDSVKTQTDRLNYLVGDMLTLAKNEEVITKKTVKKYRTVFSLSEETISCALSFEALIYENGKSLTTYVTQNLNGYGDAQGFRTVMGILLDNAVKYSAPNSAINLTLKKKGTRSVLIITNKGSQVHDQDSNKIFERFYRSDDSRSRESGGSGLGLAIAKAICDNNKWKISAKSEYNVSMTVTVTI